MFPIKLKAAILLGALAGAAAAGGPRAKAPDFAPLFRAYPETVLYTGQPGHFNFRRHRELMDVKQEISEGLKGGANFAGHYTVICWSCGTECTMGLIVDTPTGDYCDAFMCCGSAEYQKDSNLLITNTNRDNRFMPSPCKIAYHVFDGHKLKEIAKPNPVDLSEKRNN